MSKLYKLSRRVRLLGILAKSNDADRREWDIRPDFGEQGTPGRMRRRDATWSQEAWSRIGGGTSVPDALEVKIRSIIHDVFRRGESFPVLQVICFAHRADLKLDPELHQIIAESFDRDPDAVARLDQFVTDLSTPSTPGQIQMCEGLSCRGRSAGDLNALLRPIMHADHGCEIVDCLDNCGEGPSVALDERLFSGSAEDIGLDERSWRRG